MVWLLSKLAREGKSPALGRWFAANCFAAMAALQLMLPLVPQLQSYMQTDEARATIGLSWIFNTAIYFLAGVPWSKGARIFIISRDDADCARTFSAGIVPPLSVSSWWDT